MTASASAAVAISGADGGAITRSRKIAPHAGEAAFEVVVLDAGDQPAIGVVGERRQVRAAVRLPLLAGLGVGGDRDDRVVDRAEAADEAAVGDAQPDLRRRPGLVGGLGAQHIAHRVADRQQGADDLGGAGEDAVAALALLDRDGARLAVDDLHQPVGRAGEVGAFLDRGAVGCRAHFRPGIVVKARLGLC